MTPVHPRRRVLLGALALATALTTSACGGSSDGAKSGADGGGFPRTVRHAMGETTIKAAPKRVVALDSTFVDAALVLKTEVVGFTSYRSIGEKLPSYLGKPARTYGKDAVSVGLLAEPSLEKIAALKPDLILSAKVRHEALYDELSEIAPTVFSETTGATWKENLQLAAKALGKERAAKEALDAYRQRAETIGGAVAKKLGGKLPTVSVVRFLDEPTVRLYQPESYSGVVLSDLGFTRPADQPKAPDGGIAADISEENILQVDADLIFLCTWDDEKGLSEKTQERFTGNPLWSELKGEQVEVSDTTWMTAVGLIGAHIVLDDVAKHFKVDAARTS